MMKAGRALLEVSSSKFLFPSAFETSPPSQLFPEPLCRICAWNKFAGQVYQQSDAVCGSKLFYEGSRLPYGEYPFPDGL